MNIAFDPSFCPFRGKNNVSKSRLIKLLTLIFAFLLLTGCISEPTYTPSKQRQSGMALQQAELAFQQRQTPDLNSIDFNTLDSSQKARYLRLKIAMTNPNDVNAQIRNYIELEKYGSTSERQQAIDLTWNYLMSLSKNQQDSINVYAKDNTLKGWMDLLLTYQNSMQTSKAEQLLSFLTQIDSDEAAVQKQVTLKQNIADWKTRYSSHPAALYLPRAILGSDSAIYSGEALKIAVFVPQSGTSKIYGDTILAGIKEASSFNDRLADPILQIYDTESSTSLENLVRQAEQNGAQIIVGPLLKKNVEAITKIETTLPILALNKLEDEPISRNRICYFSLSPEDEAKNAASVIHKRQSKAPLILVPNTALGRRIAEAFIVEWTAQTGETALPVQFFGSTDDLINNINRKIELPLKGKSMQVKNSELVSASSFVDNQEQSNDAVYIYATTQEYILINSLLRMKSASLPPIYLSSQSNQANLSRDTRYDFNQARISDIPLLIHSVKQQKIPSYLKDDYFLVRLYAMGVDSVQLASQFERLRQNPTLNGLTGTLNVAPTCNIQQILSWGMFQSGQLVPIEEPQSSFIM